MESRPRSEEEVRKALLLFYGAEFGEDDLPKPDEQIERYVNGLMALYNLAPFVPDLDARIYKQITEHPETFDMESFHGYVELSVDLLGEPVDKDVRLAFCSTTHCIAGWAVVLGGPEADLAMKRCPEEAGALIFAKSTGSIPDFYTDDDVALEDMKQRANKE